MDQNQKDEWLRLRKDRRESLTADTLLERILKKDVSALSAGITLLESTNATDRMHANALVKNCLPYAGNSIRIGITGVPGVGKSTFIESFGQLLVKKGKKVAILAIDPTSSISGGSILGDKTRMQELSQLKDVFIRPSPAGETLGGVARRTRESIYLCEAAGFDVVLIETVGVGQSETLVHSMVDFFLLLMLSGAGDELQGIKRGIMEMADALVITKADGDNIKKAEMACSEYKNAMHLFPPKQNEWIPQALTCSSVDNQNIDNVWKVIESYENQTKLNSSFLRNRKEQDKHWLKESLNELILNGFYGDDNLIKMLQEAQKNIELETESSFSAAEILYQHFLKAINHGRV